MREDISRSGEITRHKSLRPGSNYTSVGAQTVACRREYANPASFKRSDGKPGDGGKSGIQMRALSFIFFKVGSAAVVGLMREQSCCLAKSPTVGSVWGRINRT